MYVNPNKLRNKLLAYLLVFAITSFSILAPALSKPEPVQGEVIALTTAGVIGSLLISLGVTGDIINGLSDKQAEAMQRQLELEIASENARTKFHEAFEQAKTTGKLVIDSASGAWSDIKEWVSARFPDTTASVPVQQFIQPSGTFDASYIKTMLGLYPFSGFVKLSSDQVDSWIDKCAQLASNTNLWSFSMYIDNRADSSMYNKIGGFYFSCYNGVYPYDSLMINERYHPVDINGCDISSNFSFVNYDSMAVYTNHFGGDAFPFMNSSNSVRSWFYYSSPLARTVDTELVSLQNDYASVYNPVDEAVATDIITPDNTAVKQKDGSIAIGGDYVIDIATPLTYPVDLTTGVVIGQDLTIDKVIPVTDEAEDEEDKPPITPDLPTPPTVTPEMQDIVSDMPDFSALKQLFPFCIPFDLLDAIKAINATGKAPKFTAKIPIPDGKGEPYIWEWTLDLAEYEELAKIMRAGFVALFLVGLFFVTKALSNWNKGE